MAQYVIVTSCSVLQNIAKSCLIAKAVLHVLKINIRSESFSFRPTSWQDINMPTILEIVTAKMESKKRDGEIQLKSQGERMPDSELGTEINSLSAKSNNANRPSPLKSTPELNLHQPAVET